MPAKRPEGDAVAVWLILQVKCDGRRGWLKRAFYEMSQSLQPFTFRKPGRRRPLRGRTAFIDKDTGMVVGDKLSIPTIRAYHEHVQKRRRQDAQFKEQTDHWLAQLKADVGPGSILIPFRDSAAASKFFAWRIVKYWLDGPRVAVHFSNPPPPGYALELGWADEPDGPIEIDRPDLK